MANSIKIGGYSFDSLKIGGSDVDAAYLGDTLVYSGGTPPTFQGKWLATYSGGTTSSADCDASSAITRYEITKANLIAFEIGDCVTSIDNSLFEGCYGLTSINIPDSVTTIGNSAFNDCSSLTSCTIGSGVTSIGDDAFFDCGGLTSITVESTTPPTLGYSAFDYTNNCPIYVPSASVSAYQSAWSDYALRIQEIPNS